MMQMKERNLKSTLGNRIKTFTYTTVPRLENTLEFSPKCIFLCLIRRFCAI